MTFSLQGMFDVGVIRRIQTTTLASKNNDFYPNYREVDLDEAFQTFACLLLGVIISLLFLVIEKIICRMFKKQEKSAKMNFGQFHFIM